MTTARRALVLAFAVAACLAPRPGRAAVITEYPLTPGSAPRGIALGPDGNIWFVEKNGNKVGFTTPLGAITELPLSTPASSPQNITFSPDGTLYVSEPGAQKAGQLRLFDNAGMTEMDASPGISMMVSGQRGNAYYIDGTDTVSWYFPGLNGGGTPCTFAQQGKAHAFAGIASSDNSELYLTDPAANEVVRLDPVGCLFYPTLLPNPFSDPNSIAMGRDGYVWFTERLGNRIGRLDRSDNLTEFPLPAGSAPEMIAAGPDGTMWFAERGTNKIGHITHNGTITHYDIPTPSSLVFGVAVGGDGSVWFTEEGAAKLGRLQLRSYGDANADGNVNVTDVLYVINFLFAGGPAPK